MGLPLAPPVDPSQIREKKPHRAEIISFWVVFALMAVWTLANVSLPLMSFLMVIVLGLLWLVVGGWWAMLGARLGGSRSLLVTVLLAPLLVVGLLAFSLTDLPLRWRFELSRASFDATAADLRTHADPSDPGLVGNYLIVSAVVEDDIVVLYEASSGMINDGGFVHVPEGDPGQLDSSYEMLDWTGLGGGWYAFVASW